MIVEIFIDAEESSQRRPIGESFQNLISSAKLSRIKRLRSAKIVLRTRTTLCYVAIKFERITILNWMNCNLRRIEDRYLLH